MGDVTRIASSISEWPSNAVYNSSSVYVKYYIVTIISISLNNWVILFFRIISSFEAIAENLVGQENVTRAIIIEQNIGLAGAKVCNDKNRLNKKYIDLQKINSQNMNQTKYRQMDEDMEM